MLKKEITFEDLEGRQVTETYYFGLNKAEVAEMELGAKGGSLAESLQQIVKDQDGQGIIDAFKKIISSSIGVKHSNGRQFVKTDEIRDNFMQSDAYSELFMELVTNAAAGAEFVNGIMPANLTPGVLTQDVPTPTGPAMGVAEANVALARPLDLTRAQATLASNQPPVPMIREAQVDSQTAAKLEDLSNMSREELQAAFEKLRQTQYGTPQ